MRILHISNPVPVPPTGLGGSEKVVYNLAKTQAEHGHDVSVMAGLPTDVPRVRNLSFTKGRTYTENDFIPKRFLSGYTLRSLLKANWMDEFDVIHNHISEEAIPFSCFSKYPMVTTLHCPMTLERFWPKLTNTIAKYLPKKTYFVPISSRSYKSYEPYFKDKLLDYVHHGMDLSQVPFNRHPETDYDIEICYLNRFIPEKNPFMAMEVADKLVERRYDVHLTMMGSMDESDPEFNEKVISWVDDREYVDIIPNVPTDEMFKILGNSHVMINPSIEIGLNLAQLEALSTGTPVVGLKNGIAEEVVSIGKTGFIGESVEKMADYCIKAKQLDRDGCREYVQKEFSLKQMYERYMEAYNQVM